MLLHLLIVVNGTTVYSKVWNGPPVEDRRFLHVGPALSTMTAMASQISPAGKGGLRVIELETTRVEFFTSPTGVLFIGTATPDTPSLSGLFGVAYSAFASHIVLNPMADPKQPLKAPKFEAALEAYVAANASTFGG